MELNKTLQEIHAAATEHGVRTVFIPEGDFTRYQGKSRTHCGHDDTGDMITFNDVVIRPCDGPPYVEKPRGLKRDIREFATPEKEPVPAPADDDFGGYRADPLNDDFAHERSRLDSSRKPEPHTAHQPKVEHRGKKK